MYDEVANLTAFIGYHQKNLLDITKILPILGFYLNIKNNQSNFNVIIEMSFYIYILSMTSCECLKLSVGVRLVTPTHGGLQQCCRMQSAKPKKVFNETMSFPPSVQKSLWRKTQYFSSLHINIHTYRSLFHFFAQLFGLYRAAFKSHMLLLSPLKRVLIASFLLDTPQVEAVQSRIAMLWQWG